MLAAKSTVMLLKLNVLFFNLCICIGINEKAVELMACGAVWQN